MTGTALLTSIKINSHCLHFCIILHILRIVVAGFYLPSKSFFGNNLMLLYAQKDKKDSKNKNKISSI
jgi:hypothetical protein